MAFTFEDVSNEGATLTLRWAELAVPVRITAHTHQLALASFRDQLNGLAQYFWQGWNQAANYCLSNDVELEQGLEWAERSVQIQPTFQNLSTQVQLLEKLGRGEETEALMERAVEKGNAGDLYGYGRSLINQGEKEKALAGAQREGERRSVVRGIRPGLRPERPRPVRRGRRLHEGRPREGPR